MVIIDLGAMVHRAPSRTCTKKCGQLLLFALQKIKSDLLPKKHETIQKTLLGAHRSLSLDLLSPILQTSEEASLFQAETETVFDERTRIS